MKRGICKRGHPITDATAYVWRGKRQCGICKRARSKARGRRLAEYCTRGHVFTAANTRITARGQRQCLDCKAFTVAARLASKGHQKRQDPELPDKPVVKRVAYRVVVDPVTAAIFGRRD